MAREVSSLAAHQAMQFGIDCFEHGYHLDASVLKETVPRTASGAAAAGAVFQPTSATGLATRRASSSAARQKNPAIRMGSPG